MACAICKTRREKRHCPGVRDEICAICCGEEREETVACPLDCEYLHIAHHQETRERKDPAAMPNHDFRISQAALEKNLELIMAMQLAILVPALDRNAIDNDVKQALDGLVRTYKTLDSGLYYDSRPANPIAAAIFDAVQQRVTELRQAENERGVHKILDSQVLTVLVFLQQMEYTFNNDRKRGRCFIDNLRTTMAGVPYGQEPDPSPLIVS
jgi:hypothetical protein